MSRIWEALQEVERNRDSEPGVARPPRNRGTLTQKQQAAVRGLLQADSLKGVAEASGVSERTLRKWLDQPEFLAAVYEAGEEQVAQSLQRLRAATADAVEVLRAALRDDDPMVRIGAAAAILRAAGVEPGRECGGGNGAAVADGS